MMAVLAAVFAGEARTNYVDCKLGDYTGHDGSTWELAFKTIQEGVESCNEGDTVLVAYGRYNEGGAEYAGEPGYANRVCISTKSLTVIGVDGADKTFIEGSRDFATAVDDLGNGPGAVRCLLVSANDVVVQGFTLTGGAAHPVVAKENNSRANGGGFRSTATGNTGCIVDCVVSNCVGVRAGAVYAGRAVRCLIADNTCSVKASAANSSLLLNCVVTRNSNTASASIMVSGTAVNCTFYRNAADYVGSERASFRNCVVMCNNSPGNGELVALLTAYNSVFPTGTAANGNPLFSTVENCVTNASPFQFANPVFDDVRLVPGCESVGVGDPSRIDAVSLSARVDKFLDFAGNEIRRDGAINAGAFQRLAPAPQGGALLFQRAGFAISGVSTRVADEYVFAETYPTQFRVSAALGAGRHLVAYRRYGRGYPSSGEFIVPLMDNTIWMMPPPAGMAYTNDIVTASKCYYVDPNIGDDSHAGTSDAPLKTIQAAVKLAQTTRTVIYCAAGTYDSDDCITTGFGMTNRVTISEDQTLRIIGAGAGLSIIKGATDTNDPAGDGYGRGPAAIRCVACLSSSLNIIQGFTLSGGRCGYVGDGTGSLAVHQGGGVVFAVARANAQQLADCVIDDCIGYRGALYCGWATRCRFTNCLGLNGGVRYARVSSSLFYGNLGGTGNGKMISSNSEFFNCTIIGRDKTSEVQIVNSVPVTNSVIWRIASTDANWWLGGTYVGEAGGAVQSGIAADPQLVDPANGDYSLLATSPCVGGGLMWEGYARDYMPDVNGNPIVFANGRPTAGAVQTLKAAYAVNGNGLNGASFSPAGTNALAAGESVTITFDGAGVVRPITGFLVNGEVQGYSPTASWTYTAPAAGERVTAGFTVAPIFSTNWYVNAGTEVADGTGFSADSPKKAFHGAGGVFDECDVRAGDCIHVEEGMYAEGEGKCDFGTSTTSSGYVNARCSVPAGVTVTADGAVERTVLVGADGTTGPVDAKGRGTNSVRCVYLRPNSSVIGFTLTGGRTCGDGASNPNNYGGGVYACDDTSRAIGCVISNNASCRGGGMHNGWAVRCRFFDNWAKNNRAAMSAGYMYGCVVDRNRGVNATQNTKGVWNCTFGPGNTTEDGTTTTQSMGMPFGPVVNSIACQNVQVDTSKASYFTNCIFVSVTDSKKLGVYSDCITTNADILTFDDVYAPVIGVNPAVDAGAAGHLPAVLASAPDANGGQRIYNGAIDIGAVEADWRPVYAATLGANVAVTAATENVTVSVGKVRLADGDALAGVWNPSIPDLAISYSMLAESDGGALTGAFEDGAGATLASVSISSGFMVPAFSGKNLSVGFAFASESGASLLSAFAQKARSTVIVLR